MLPKVSLNDGKHKLIVAEAGERVLTPKENLAYEKSHPSARKEPMKADIVYDLGGIVSGIGDRIKNQTPEQKQRQINNMPGGEDPGHTQTTPMLNQMPMYDEGGKVEHMPSIPERIITRAKELYNQGKALVAPMDTEIKSLQEKQRNVNDVAPKPAMKTLGEPQPAMGKAYDCGGMVYDDGGVVTPTDHEKEAAYHQAAAEVHAEEAAKENGPPVDFGGAVLPNPKGIKVQADTDKPERSDGSLPGGARMNTDLAPVGPPNMDVSNPESNQMESMGTEASARSPLGSTGAPRTPKMRPLPLQVRPEPPKTAPEAPAEAPDINTIIQQDKIDAAKRGHAGLSDLGLAMIHENALGTKPKAEPVGPELVQGTPEKPTYTGDQSLEVAKRDTQLKQLREKMLYAPTEQERFQAEKDLAELKRRTPWGSAENHPGVLGKILHGISSVAQGAARGVAPYVLPAIPGSQANIAQQENIGEQGVEQAQEKRLKAAQTASAEQQPELKKEQQKLAAEKLENALRIAGYKTDPDTGEHVPLTYEEMSPQQQAVYDQKESVQTLNEAKSHEQEAKAILEKYKADPNSAQNQAALARIQDMARRAGIAAEKLGLDKAKYMADYFGLGTDGQPIPGAEVNDQGKPVGPKMSKGSETTSQRLNKSDLSQNVQLNAKRAIKMIEDNPELFGKVAGRYTNVRQMAGSGDQAIIDLGIEVHNMAVASAGIHGQRGQAAVEAYEKDILNKFHNSPAATISGLNELSGSVQTFIDDAKAGKHAAPTPGTTPSNTGGTSAFDQWKKSQQKASATQ